MKKGDEDDDEDGDEETSAISILGVRLMCVQEAKFFYACNETLFRHTARTNAPDNNDQHTNGDC
jgi:hypothetical protein